MGRWLSPQEINTLCRDLSKRYPDRYAHLPKDAREVVYRRGAGETNVEIARSMGRPAKTITEVVRWSLDRLLNEQLAQEIAHSKEKVPGMQQTLLLWKDRLHLLTRPQQATVERIQSLRGWPHGSYQINTLEGQFHQLIRRLGRMWGLWGHIIDAPAEQWSRVPGKDAEILRRFLGLDQRYSEPASAIARRLGISREYVKVRLQYWRRKQGKSWGL